MNTAQFADNLDPAFRKIFHDTEKQWPSVMERIFNVESSSLHAEKMSANSGLGLTPVKTEGTATTLDTRVQLYDKTFTHVAYGVGVEITREMMDDDLSGSMKATPQAMSISGKQTIETLAANHFNRHVTGAYTGPDGKVLCATDHPAYGSASQSNLGTAGSLTHSTLAAGRLAMKKMKNHRGLFQRVDPKILLVPPDLEEKAQIIVNTDRKSGSANWDVNIFNGSGIEIVVWNFITVTTAYWLIGDKAQHQMYWFWRTKPEFNRDRGVSEQIAKWYTYFRCISGHVDWRGIWGNNGA